MSDRALLEQTLNDRGVPFDYYASDDALELMVAQSDAAQYDPAQPLENRGQLEVYLQARRISYDPKLSDADLLAFVLTQQDAEHARYLETYAPVITRLPAAVDTAPELPDESATESGAEPQSAATDTDAAHLGEATDDGPEAEVAQPNGEGVIGRAPAVESDADPAA